MLSHQHLPSQQCEFNWGCYRGQSQQKPLTRLHLLIPLQIFSLTLFRFIKTTYQPGESMQDSPF
jgi:hypothetical protein